MNFSSNVDRRKTNPLIYVKFRRQLECCQAWFHKKLFYVPDFIPRALSLRLTELNSVEAEIVTRKLLFLARLVTEPKMAPSVSNSVRSRTEILFDTDVESIGILLSI